MKTPTLILKARSLVLALVSALAAVAACDEGPLEPNADPSADIVALHAEQPNNDTGYADGSTDGLRVLSRNVFLGADLEPVVGAAATGDPQAIVQAVAGAWAQIEANDFPTRAGAIAREIAASGADVVGLQEVALFHTQFPGDGPGGAPATDVAYDYLQILLDELEARGSRYSVAATGSSIQVELPAYDPTSPTGIMDVRYTDRDVVLVREGVEVVDSESGVYAVALPVPGPLGISLPRGYNQVDLIHEGRMYHFVNTHLETDEASIDVQTAQALELVGMLGDPSVPTIVVGDLNGQPSAQNDGTVVYALLEGAGFTDAWSPSPSNPNGYTCCFDKDLLVQPGEELFERIDYVFVRGGGEGTVNVLDTYTVGAGQRYGTVEDERWPADHAGVFAAVAPVSAAVAE